MSLTHLRSYLAAAALLFGSATSHADPNAPAPPPEPFLVTLHVANTHSQDYLDLDNPSSSFDITVKNMSSDAKYIGYRNFTLQIAAIGAYKLSVPYRIVDRRMWAAAYALQLIQPGEETEVHFLVSYLPRFCQVLPNGIYRASPYAAKVFAMPYHDNRLVSGLYLPRLAGVSNSRFETVTASVVYTMRTRGGRIGSKSYKVITREIISAPVTFKTGL